MPGRRRDTHTHADGYTDSDPSDKPDAYTSGKPDTYRIANATTHAHPAFSADSEISSDPTPKTVRLGIES